MGRALVRRGALDSLSVAQLRSLLALFVVPRRLNPGVSQPTSVPTELGTSVIWRAPFQGKVPSFRKALFQGASVTPDAS